MRTAGILIAAVVLSASLAQAQPVRDSRGAAGGAAVLAGAVVSDDSEPRPVRHARVICSGSELSHAVTAISDERGRFTCADLPPGRYTASATRDGWVAAAYGATQPLQPGTPVALADGERADIVIRMLRGAVITGMLLDESGQPATGATVVALRASQQNGQQRLTATGPPAVADDRGVYRIFGLPPGDYYVGAGASGTTLSVLEAQLTTEIDVRHARTAAPTMPPPERHVAFASTYYPGTAFAAQAAALQLRAGEERADVDFALQLVPTARVEGTLLLPDATPAPGAAQITIVASGASAFAGSAFDGMKTARPSGDGTFEFAGVAPGTYTVLARLASPSVLWASTQVSVDGDTISGLTIALQPTVSIAGELRVAGSGRRPPFSLAAVKITAEPVQSVGEVSLSPAAVTADAAGHFVVRGLMPGRYRLVAALPAAGRTGGWSQAVEVSASVAGQSVTGAIITLTDQTGSR